jgi:hypothetical protein
MAFNVYKWRRDQLLLENNTSNDAGGTELIKSKQYSKEDIIKAVGMYGKIKLGSGEAMPVSNLDNEGKYTYTMDSYSVSAQKAVPVFIPAGKPKSIGSPDRAIKYQIDLEKEKGKKPRLDENKIKNQYVVKDEEFSDADGDFYYIDEKKALTYLKQFNKSAGRYIRDEEGFGEFSTSIDNVEKMTDKQLEREMRDDMELYFGN